MHKTTPVTTRIPKTAIRGAPARRRQQWTLELTLVLSMLLTACSSIQGLVGIKSTSGGHVVSVNEELWTISFRPDGSAADDSLVVPGEVLIQARGQVVQTISHNLSRDAVGSEDNNWLLVEDVNNDGLPDFLLTHAPASPEASPVKSLYLFDAQSQSFQLQTQVSKLGDIDKLSGCVVVTAPNMDESRTRTYCFSGEESSWMEIKRPSSSTGGRCNIKSQKLADCRGLRNQRDEEMLGLITSYIDTKSKAMAEEKRKTAALRFARNLRVGHKQWLLYRDARCASYVIEYNFPPNTSGFEMESCKLDLSSLQLQHYAAMLTSLDK